MYTNIQPGFAAASALAEKIVHGSQEDRDRYIDYLKAGKSDYPLNVMRKLELIWRRKTTSTMPLQSSNVV